MSEQKLFSWNETAEALLKFTREQFDSRKQRVHFIEEDDEVNELLNPLGRYPHAFVLGCIMDRQISAANAWRIPKWVKDAFNFFDMESLSKISLDELKRVFNSMEKKHRYPDQMAEYFFHAVQKIHNDYSDDASRIWKDKPSSGLLIYRFMQFEGVGIKIATMATNILVRQFGIELHDKCSIDISPDVHIVRIFQRLGLTSFSPSDKNKYKTETIYMARAINPDYPGIFDYPCWFVGSHFCDAQGPKCQKEDGQCPFFDFCPSRRENK